MSLIISHWILKYVIYLYFVPFFGNNYYYGCAVSCCFIYISLKNYYYYIMNIYELYCVFIGQKWFAIDCLRVINSHLLLPDVLLVSICTLLMTCDFVSFLISVTIILFASFFLNFHLLKTAILKLLTEAISITNYIVFEIFKYFF